jgi:Cohesin domain
MTEIKRVMDRCGWTKVLFIGFFSAVFASATVQTPSLSLSGASGAPGANVTLNVSLSPGAGTLAASVQWDLTYNSTDLSLVTGTYDGTGSAASGAGKLADCNAISAGDVRCIISGINQTAIGNGIVATISFQISSETTDTSTLVSLVSAAASDGSANSLSITDSGATVTINQSLVPVLSGLICTPSTVTPPATSTCTVSLSGAASGTTTINLSSDLSSATVPASVNITTGLSSANFTVTTSTVSVTSPALITAMYGGNSASFPVILTPSAGLAYYPLTPCRIADTRAGFGFSGAFGAPSLVADATRSFPVQQSACGVPNTAQAYSLNITVMPHGAVLGYLTAWPTGLAAPSVSTVNSPNGFVVANAAIVSAGTSGAINLYASEETDVLIDIDGYFAPASGPQALSFYGVTPCRVADTRTGFGFSGAFGPPSLEEGATRNFPVQQSSCAIPPAAQVYSVRMTALPPAALGYLTTWPEDQAQPNVSTLNAPGGGVVGNQAMVPAGTETGGPISVYASDTTNLLIDINGYFGPPGNTGALTYYPMTPCRIADTRTGFGFTGVFGPPSLVGGATRSFPVQQSSCGIPSSAQAYSLNLTTVVPAEGSLGWLTAFPNGDSTPDASTVNAPDGGVVASSAIVPAGAEGSISVYASSATNLLLDISGYFAP